MNDEVEVIEAEEPAAVVDEQNTEQVEEGSESTPESTEAETTKPDEPKPETEEQRKSKYQRRIDRKNADIAAARTEARLYKERLEQLEAMARPQQQRVPGAPTLDQFDNFEDYMSARVAFEAERVVETRLGKVQQAEAQRKAQEAQSRVLTSWQDKQAAAADKYADFEEVVGESDAPVTQAMSQAIVESEAGADIAYYLAQHPDEAKRIAQLSPVRQIAEIGKLEAKASAPVVKRPTSTPPPINPIGTKAKAEKDPSQMTDSEFAQWRKRQIAQRA